MYSQFWPGQVSRVSRGRLRKKKVMTSGILPEIKFQKKSVYDLSKSDLAEIDIIVSNPPYVSSQEYLSEVDASVKKWEDIGALVPSTNSNGRKTFECSSGTEILEFLIELYNQLPKRQRGSSEIPGLVVEMGASQTQLIASKLSPPIAPGNIFSGLTRAEIWTDSFGHDRVVAAYPPPSI
ncbi:hypothetical protein AYI68_g1305 [Smittium mucronatum]|uniref:Uncharacterized protein n=1 Tax=Smittium mucronatum TaxID=133383 RepID=A0A1R0H5R9_9FUNG|nr:hypothetical protein AYI68_g1305 [Smittium mucronatum]